MAVVEQVNGRKFYQNKNASYFHEEIYSKSAKYEKIVIEKATLSQ